MNELHVFFFDDFERQSVAGGIGERLFDDLLFLLLVGFLLFSAFFADVLCGLFGRFGSLGGFLLWILIFVRVFANGGKINGRGSVILCQTRLISAGLSCFFRLGNENQ